MEFQTNIRNINGSYYIRVPQDLVKYLKLEDRDTIIVQDEEGKQGKYFSAWKKEDLKE